MADFQANPRSVPVAVTGYRDTSSTLSQRVIVDVQDEIMFYMPSASPLITLTGKLRKKRMATQYKYDWLTKDEYPRAVQIVNNQLAGDTAITLQPGQGNQIAPNFLMLNIRTREVILVVSVLGDQLNVVQRAVGGLGAAMNAGDTLVYLNTAFEDGAGFGVMKSIQEVDEFNYTQIFRTQYGFTGRQMNTDLFGGKDPMTERKAQGIEHQKSIEQAFFFGKRSTGFGPGGKLRTTTGGLEYYIQSNIWDLNGTTPSERAFVEALEEGLRWGRGGYQEGSGTKYLFASSRWCSELEFWGKDKIMYRVGDSTLGLAFGEYMTTHGRVMIIKDVVLDYQHPDYAFLVDLNHVRYVYHQGRDTKLLTDRQGRDVDALQEEYLSDVGAQVELEASHMIFKGLSL